jgi:hypothetical protein
MGSAITEVQPASDGGGFKYPTGPRAYSLSFGPDTYPGELVKCETETSKPTAAGRRRMSGRAVLRIFLDELRLVCASAVIQCHADHPHHSHYETRAAENLTRIARGAIRL